MRPSHHSVVLQYRPHVEESASDVIAVAYIDGVFYNLISLRQARSGGFTDSAHRTEPQWQHSTVEERLSQPRTRYIAVKKLDPGIRPFPKQHGDVVVVSPHKNSVSRLFSYLLYEDYEPVLQQGCLDCALSIAKKNGKRIVVAGIDRARLT